ncbi:MAG: DciA family protein [Acidobacteriota bacterium]
MKDFLASLPAIMRNIDTEGNTIEPVVFAAWKRCVEGSLAEHIVPVRIENKRLIAAVANETWRKQVADLGSVITDKINAAVGSKLIRFIEFQIDPAAVRAHRKSIAETSVPDWTMAADEQLSPALTEAADSIRDSELREKFLAAATRSLAGRERYKR